MHNISYSIECVYMSYLQAFVSTFAHLCWGYKQQRIRLQENNSCTTVIELELIIKNIHFYLHEMSTNKLALVVTYVMAALNSLFLP